MDSSAAARGRANVSARVVTDRDIYALAEHLRLRAAAGSVVELPDSGVSVVAGFAEERLRVPDTRRCVRQLVVPLTWMAPGSVSGLQAGGATRLLDEIETFAADEDAAVRATGVVDPVLQRHLKERRSYVDDPAAKDNTTLVLPPPLPLAARAPAGGWRQVAEDLRGLETADAVALDYGNGALIGASLAAEAVRLEPRPLATGAGELRHDWLWRGVEAFTRDVVVGGAAGTALGDYLERTRGYARVAGSSADLWLPADPAVWKPSCDSCGGALSAESFAAACDRCMEATYCSEKCQRADWQAHRSRCDELAAAAGYGSGSGSGSDDGIGVGARKRRGGRRRLRRLRRRGLTAAKALRILRERRARGRKLTAKQKRFFGWIAGGG
jgi:hypothetical protein